MRDNNSNAAALANTHDRAGECFIALGVQIGIRFVEHDQERITVKRPRKRNALRLAGGKAPLLLSPTWVS